MLLWALFTLGFFFGVFMTLGVFLKKDVVEGVESGEGHQIDFSDPWLLHRKLVEVNYKRRKASTHADSEEVNSKLPSALKPSLAS